MATHLINEEKQIIKLVEQLPLGERVTAKLAKTIEEKGFNEELAKEIHDRITKAQEKDEENRAALGRFSMELAGLVRRWRLASQSQHFAKH
ncbi:MAG: hypothetical protein ABSA51_04850 [Anaerolineaceae bacterium]|jgi:hypothetical protein